MRDVIDVRIRQSGGWFWPCLLVIAAFMYWKWVLLILGSIAALFLIWWLVKAVLQDLQDQAAMEAAAADQARRERERLRRNATVENRLWHEGDPRGTYGMDYEHGKEPGS